MVGAVGGGGGVVWVWNGGDGDGSEDGGKGALAARRVDFPPPPSSLRKLWLSAPRDGPEITDSMAAVGRGMSLFEELVVDDLKETDKGWGAFALVRIAARAAATATAPVLAGRRGGREAYLAPPRDSDERGFVRTLRGNAPPA